jgi:methionine synthase reductase
MKRIYVLYGSQHGNTEAVAKNIYETFESKNLDVVCQTLNSVTNTNFENSTIIILCSTTGNGDSPDNACNFWKKIKNRSIERNYFGNVDYIVLGLGDTNFSNYCQIGKMIDKRISELGGNRLFELTCIDDSKDPDKDIEEWKCMLEKCIEN